MRGPQRTVERCRKRIVPLVLPGVVGQGGRQAPHVDLQQSVGQRTPGLSMLKQLGQQFIDRLGKPALAEGAGRRVLAHLFVQASMQRRQDPMQHATATGIVDRQARFVNRLQIQHALHEELKRAQRVLLQSTRAPNALGSEALGQRRLGRLGSEHAFEGSEALAALARRRSAQPTEEIAGRLASRTMRRQPGHQRRVPLERAVHCSHAKIAR